MSKVKKQLNNPVVKTELNVVELWWHQADNPIEVNKDFNSICFNFNKISPESAIEFIQNYFKPNQED